MWMTRGGWTLHEMLISLCVMGGVFAIVAHQATTQIRLYTGVEQTAGARENRAQTEAIAERILWGLAPQAGDVTVALDSALQLRMQIGSSTVCAAAPGRVTLASADAAARGNVLGAFSDAPEPGDDLVALFHDSLGTTWLTFRITTTAVVTPCERFPTAIGWQLGLAESIVLPEGAAVRLLRPLRLSLYKASDARWYLGAKEWDGAGNRFHTIQPVAGPYAKYDPAVERTGFGLEYRARTREVLASPFDASRIASISIRTRAVSGAVTDSGVVTVALRNAQ